MRAEAGTRPLHLGGHPSQNGPGIQGHLFKPLVPVVPDVDLVRETIAALAGLGLEVALTEVDAPVLPDTPDQLGEQARRVRALVEACLAVRRCRGVTFWDLDDGVSWLNGLFGRSDLAPTLFDAALQRKPAYFAVRDAFTAAAGR
jgi:endo-1,4-beta-xylanase